MEAKQALETASLIGATLSGSPDSRNYLHALADMAWQDEPGTAEKAKNMLDIGSARNGNDIPSPRKGN